MLELTIAIRDLIFSVLLSWAGMSEGYSGKEEAGHEAASNSISIQTGSLRLPSKKS